MGTSSTIFQVVAFGAAILELLDIVAFSPSANFEITGGFESSWRTHAWEGDVFMLQGQLVVSPFSVMN